MSRIAILTGDPLGPDMAGPGIRAWHMARALAEENDVALLTTSSCELDESRFQTYAARTEWDVRVRTADVDVLIVQGDLLHRYPALAASDKVIVADLYDPFHLEWLEHGKDFTPATRRYLVREATAVIDEMCLRSDFFLCASERQRHFWLGHLAALGRVNPCTYEDDPSLRSLLAVVPFGIPDEPPERTAPALRGVLPRLDHEDHVLLWGGGVYNWFDPLTLIRAVSQLVTTYPRLRLVFLGMSHPLSHVSRMRMAGQARQLAADLGLVDTHVFFNDTWVPYRDRANYLLDADIGVSCHLESVETLFSFRTRMLDYLWAGLPIVATKGDVFADLIEKEGIGSVVPAGDVDALAEAIGTLLADPTRRAACAAAARRAAAAFHWSVVLRPLVEFCRSPRRAPDLLERGTARRLDRERRAVRRRVTGWRRTLELAAEHYTAGGIGRVARKAASRILRAPSDRRPTGAR